MLAYSCKPFTYWAQYETCSEVAFPDWTIPTTTTRKPTSSQQATPIPTS